MLIWEYSSIIKALGRKKQSLSILVSTKSTKGETEEKLARTGVDEKSACRFEQEVRPSQT